MTDGTLSYPSCVSVTFVYKNTSIIYKISKYIILIFNIPAKYKESKQNLKCI